MRILIAVDDTTESLDAVHTAYELFGDGAAFTVASVGERPPIAPITPWGVSPIQVDLAEVTKSNLDEANRVARVAASELPGVAAIRTDVGWAGQAICGLAEQESSDVVVIGSHDRSTWQRLLHPSVGKYIVEHAPCSVLLVR